MKEIFGRSTPYTAPFVIFMVLLAAQSYVPLPQRWEFGLRCTILAGALWYFSRDVVSFKLVSPLGSIALGIAVFVIWIGPDYLFPAYRGHWLFQNSITGKVATAISTEAQTDIIAIVFRSIRAVLLVPIIEELFWRAWGLRWVANSDFETLPLGSYTTQSFWIIAALFAAEHGPFWDVGLVCGILWNWWMGKTKSLGDLILTHAVANGCLSAYVLAAKQWQYWM